MVLNFEFCVFGGKLLIFGFEGEDLRVGVDEEVFLRETFLRGAQEAVVEGDSVVEIGFAIFENEVAAVAGSEALRAFEHCGKDDHRDAGQLDIAAETVVSNRVVLQLVAGALGGEHIRGEEMGGIHDAHDGDVDVDVVVLEMQLHSVKSVDEDVIAGEVLAELIFRLPVLVICAMREVVH